MPPKKSYESYDDSDSDDSQGQRRGSGKRQKLDKNSDEYKTRRERNNLAVRKSREASRKKAKETMDKVGKLRDENKALEQKVTILKKELLVLRDLFLTHASATAPAGATTESSVSTGEAESPPDSGENVSIKDEAEKDHLYFLKGELG